MVVVLLTRSSRHPRRLGVAEV
ncbi:hypothetical protein EIB18_13455 [Caulobacter vibrioides]|uniref:Uncharacterized protein n=3 Tax=Caulobacter TaxID=75 RepID=A0A0H3IZJ5_CAUVN|nr:MULTISPECIES: hypothetical protein [Caulobacter]YP_009020543.1 hypothetical protein CCNA_03971 [Caulobacter vibrioides NA1000]MCA0358224.1 hypothetical protein [Pseudomonadota bacterium]QBQ57512.1 hypothetical protein EUX21_02785 [synthetic Caulobacter sp. 'ethensis']AHI88574.1 hypothetical protein CCNA_03971 [Caulobacter vibrioides NA1000]AVG21602.1 hypothetical protein CA608_20350 [Caulobacter vibrioides]AVH77131.1 hypothetical protein CA607_20490 [Caulobacter vibrioides]